MNAHELLVEQLRDHMLADQDQLAATSDMVCDLCEKPSSRWAGGSAFAYIAPCSYRTQTIQCAACRILTCRSPHAMGLERHVRGTPVFMSLTSLKQGILVLERGRQPELWVGGKYVDKLERSVFNVRSLSGNEAKRALLERHITDQPTLIIELSLRRERIVQNLMLSSRGVITFCTETGVIRVPQHGWPSFLAALKSLPGTRRSGALSLLRGLVSGRYRPNDPLLRDLWESAPDLAAACSALPADPYAREFWLFAGSAS